MSEITLRDGSQSIVFLGERPYPLPPEGVWEFSDLVDWGGQTDDKLPVRERPQGHGAFDTDRSLRASRTPSFNARFAGNSAEQTEQALEVLDAMGAEGPVEMIVTTPGRSTLRRVTVENIERTDRRSRLTGSVAVDLIARDPRRYDVTAQSVSTGPAQPGPGRTWPAIWPLVWPAGGSSGRITLTNTGKAPSAPTFILDGGFDTALITCLETGSRIGFNRQVPVGSSVVIATANRTAMIDGQSDVSRWLRYREWELIPPGASRTFQFDATGVIVTPGYSEEIGRNWNPNPRLMNSVTGWSTTGAVATLTPTATGGRIDVTTSTSVPIFFQAFDLPAATDDQWSGSMELTVPAGFPAAAVQLRTYAYGMNTVVGASAPVLIQPGTTITLAADNTTPLTSAATGVRTILYGNGIASGARVIARNALASKTATAGQYFDGSFPASGDRSFAWAGAVDGSVSIAYRVVPDSPTASLEGQVRSAWW